MQKRTVYRIVITVMLAILLCCLITVPASSIGFVAVPGALAYGTAPLYEGSVLQLDSLKVSMEIAQAPDHFYENEQGIWENYTSVTSVFSLYNPSAERVSETMAIPFGALPDYTYDEDDTSPVLPHEGAYSISFKGQSITPTVRHGLANNPQRNDQIDVMDYSAWQKMHPLHDQRQTDGIYYPEQKVTVYTYQVSNPYAIEGNEFKLVSESLERVDKTATRVCISSGGEYEGGLIGYADLDGETFRVYVIGKDIGELTWQAASWGDEYSIDSVTVSLQSRSEITYEDLAMEYYTPDCGAAEVDWYNAVYYFFTNNCARNGIIDAFQPSSHNITDYLQGWLIYEITLEPYEHAELVTKTPAFPDIINRHSPSVYEYGYDLAGLSHFAGVGLVEFTVNTPCYTVEQSSYYVAHQVPAGEYSLKLDTVEKDVIVFSICTRQQPFDIPSAVVYGILGLVVLMVIASLALVAGINIVIVIAVFATVKRIGRRKIPKEQTKDPPTTAE